MRATILFFLAGLLEIGGGYLVWIWLREHKSPALGILGLACLASYGVVPIFQSPEHPFGRIYAAYGAVFIILSVIWGWMVDKKIPDSLDLWGTAICLIGAIVMMFPRQG